MRGIQLAKHALTAKQITDRVQSLVNQLEEVIEDDATVLVSTAYWHATDAEGCNWNIASVQNGTAYAHAIRKIVDAVRAEVDIVKP